MGNVPLPRFLERAKADGFDAVEIVVSAQPGTPTEIRRQVADHGLLLVAQMHTSGRDVPGHLDTLKRLFDHAAETEPLLINSHSASDFFSLEDNLPLFDLACHLAKQSGIMIAHETHRGRPTSSAPQTRRLLEALQEMHLTADFSHWFCVHESDLSNQPENVEIAIQRCRHIHARVGFDQGPQVPDPLAPEWSAWTERHLSLWRRILEARRAAGDAFLTITPEFGPPPYMPIEPYTRRPLADAWTVNVAFRAWLETRIER